MGFALNVFFPLILENSSGESVSNVDIYVILLLKEVVCMPMVYAASWLIDTRLGRNWSTGLGYIICGFLIFILLIAMNFYALLAVSSFIWGFA